MYYLAHLALPAIVALITALSGTQIELNLSWFARTTEKLAELYMIFAAPTGVGRPFLATSKRRRALPSVALLAYIFCCFRFGSLSHSPANPMRQTAGSSISWARL